MYRDFCSSHSEETIIVKHLILNQISRGVNYSMKIATNNQLAHLQVEYDETLQQCQILQNQLVFKQQECNVLTNYLNANQGDRSARQRYRDITKGIRHIQSELRKNNQRLGSLKRRILIEKNKMMTGR